MCVEANAATSEHCRFDVLDIRMRQRQRAHRVIYPGLFLTRRLGVSGLYFAKRSLVPRARLRGACLFHEMRTYVTCIHPAEFEGAALLIPIFSHFFFICLSFVRSVRTINGVFFLGVLMYSGDQLHAHAH